MEINEAWPGLRMKMNFFWTYHKFQSMSLKRLSGLILHVENKLARWVYLRIITTCTWIISLWHNKQELFNHIVRNFSPSPSPPAKTLALEVAPLAVAPTIVAGPQANAPTFMATPPAPPHTAPLIVTPRAPLLLVTKNKVLVSSNILF